MTTRKGPPRKYFYTDEDVQEARENGIEQKSLVSRLVRGFTREEARTIPIGMHIKTYYRLNPDKAPVEEELEVPEESELVLVDRPAPWYLYQYYGMFGSW